MNIGIRQRLLNEKEKKPFLIASHRGCSGGNIIENTIRAFDAALRSGADILEMDAFRTIDGKLFVFHDGMERRLFWNECSVLEMTSHEVRQLRFINQNSFETDEGPPSLDDVLEHFKHRCLINLDRCWWCWDSIFECILRHQMQDQILLKSSAIGEYLQQLSEQDIPFLYMPIVKTLEDMGKAEKAKVNLAAVETVFSDENCPLVSDEFIDEQHRKGRLLWANPITLNHTRTLTAGHDDDRSVVQNPESGWRWLLDKKFDILCTDWPGLLKDYRMQNRL